MSQEELKMLAELLKKAEDAFPPKALSGIRRFSVEESDDGLLVLRGESILVGEGSIFATDIMPDGKIVKTNVGAIY